MRRVKAASSLPRFLSKPGQRDAGPAGEMEPLGVLMKFVVQILSKGWRHLWLGVVLALVLSCSEEVLVPEYDVAEFHQASASQIEAVVPSRLDPEGENLVRIEGRHFFPGAKVAFGATECPVTKVDPTTITCVSVEADPGFYPVTVSNRDGKSVTLKEGVTIASVPVVSRVSPGDGPLFGGRKLVLDGDNFTDDGTVYVGSHSCTDYEFINTEVVTCVLPEAVNSGEVPVTLVNRFGVACTECGTFRYNPPPEVLDATASIPEQGRS